MIPGSNKLFAGLAVVLVAAALGVAGAAEGGLTLDDLARVRGVTDAKISPDGRHVAYVLSVPRIPFEDEDGGPWAELHVADGPGRSRPFVTGEVRVDDVAWTPDGAGISFLAKRGKDEHDALYVIPVDGGEARRALAHEQDITAYSWSPDGKRVAFLAKEKRDETEEKLEDKGFKAEIYEEQWRPVRVWIATPWDEEAEPRALELAGSASELHWAPVGNRLAVALAPTSMIDDQYMRRKLHVVDADTGETVVRLDNPGKLGDVRWSPDGKRLAVVSAEDLHDPAAGRLLVAGLDGSLRDVLPGYAGHVSSVAWKDADTIVFVGDRGCLTTLGEIAAAGGEPRTLVPAGGPILRNLSLSASGAAAAFVADSPEHPREVYARSGASAAARWTDSNPWLADVRLAPQEIVRYEARDGLEIEGVLVRPLDAQAGIRYPLILAVHGGPEAHDAHGWVTNYSRPGQVAAARGFAVFYPNYRGSTGRGVEFTKLHQADYAGGEFNDLVDAIEHFVAAGLVDRAKVGVTGGSYGGFASAWCATALTEHFAASVMFVGISDHVSKAGTTDIPDEMFLVHSRRWPWEHWDWFRERSPLYHVEKARTPILILHGKDDTRVHPSQSMELYRYLELIGKTPVRLVFYPGEGHGNRKAAARYDYSRRLMRWMEHYLTGPGGDPPPHAFEEDAERLDGDDDEPEDDEADA